MKRANLNAKYVDGSPEIDMKSIQLKNNLTVLIDDEDYEMAVAYKWHAIYKRRGGKPYANTTIHISGSGKNRKKKNVTMHKMILQTDKQVDHKNGNTLDNRRENLRESSNAQNHQNIPKNRNAVSTSRFKGVVLRPNGRWEANITANRKKIYLGRFDSEIDAAVAYNAAAFKLHGDFASLNDIPVSK